MNGVSSKTTSDYGDLVQALRLSLKAPNDEQRDAHLARAATLATRVSSQELKQAWFVGMSGR